jgi:hypothetical protein
VGELAYLLEDRDEYLAERVFWVPVAARWPHLQAQAKQPTIGKALDAAMDAVEADNPVLKGALPKVYALPALDRHKLGELIDLIDLISGIGLGTKAHREQDTLGRVYEYFLSRFASAEGRGGGEFYTPSSVVRVLVEITRDACGWATDTVLPPQLGYTVTKLPALSVNTISPVVAPPPLFKLERPIGVGMVGVSWTDFEYDSTTPETPCHSDTAPPYDVEFRQSNIDLVRSGRTPAELAREFEPSAQTILNWAKQADLDSGARSDGLTSSEREELRAQTSHTSAQTQGFSFSRWSSTSSAAAWWGGRWRPTCGPNSYSMRCRWRCASGDRPT